MKTYSELCFYASKEEFEEFKKIIRNYITNDWSISTNKTYITEYLNFTYTGNEEEAAMVCICDSSYNDESCYRVVNIVPTNVNELSMEQYNHILQIFYNDIIKPYNEVNHDIKIVGPTSDVFNPVDVVSNDALKKLKSFCRNANKTTGSSHPCDQERWFDFICQTVDDNQMFSYDTLATFLQDEEYWGAKRTAGEGVISDSAWSEEAAYELASEYEAACNIIIYYKKIRGI